MSAPALPAAGIIPDPAASAIPAAASASDEVPAVSCKDRTLSAVFSSGARLPLGRPDSGRIASDSAFLARDPHLLVLHCAWLMAIVRLYPHAVFQIRDQFVAGTDAFPGKQKSVFVHFEQATRFRKRTRTRAFAKCRYFPVR